MFHLLHHLLDLLRDLLHDWVVSRGISFEQLLPRPMDLVVNLLQAHLNQERSWISA